MRGCARRSTVTDHRRFARLQICPHDGCGRAFARNFNMQSHLKSHLGIRDCSSFPRALSSPSALTLT